MGCDIDVCIASFAAGTQTLKREWNNGCPFAGRVDDVINVSGHRIGTAEVRALWDGRGQC